MAASLRAALALAVGLFAGPLRAEPGLSLSAGLGAGFAPVYAGADEYKVGPAFFFDLAYGFGNPGNSSIGFDGTLSLTIRETERLTFGVGLDYGGGRDSDESDRLEGLPDIDDGAFVRAFLGVGLTGATGLEFGLATFLDGAEGVEARIGLSHAVLLSERSTMSFGLATTWLDDERSEGLFGITDAQAAASKVGLDRFDADAGIAKVDLSATLTHAVTERVQAIAILGLSGVTGSVRDSPLNESRVNPSLAFGLIRSF